MKIAETAIINKVFVNEHGGKRYARATLSFADHRGRQIWLSHNVPSTQIDEFTTSYPEGTIVSVVGLLYADNYKAKSGEWVNRISVDIEDIKAV
jgi:hypothetical protein